MGLVLAGILVVAIAAWLFFRFGVLSGSPGATPQSLIALAVVIVISFLFTTVAAQAIAIVGTNPVSGMTLMTLILTSVFLVKAGLSGPSGMLAALLIGGVVCTALSMAGGLITDLKIGYWIGATPAVQERSKFLGTIVASLTVGAVILLLNQAYGFAPSAAHPESEVLVAPQANAMAAVIKTLMSQRAGAVAPLRRRRPRRHDDADDRRALARLRPRDVHPAGAEHAAPRRAASSPTSSRSRPERTRSSRRPAASAAPSSPRASSPAAPSWASSRRS